MTIQKPTVDIPTILKPVARALGLHFKAHLKNDFIVHSHQFYHFGGKMIYAWTGDGEITYNLQGGGVIKFFNIDVPTVNADNITVGPITPIGSQEVVRANLFTTSNYLDTDILRTISTTDDISEMHTSSLTEEVGVSVSLGFRQQLSYGSQLAGISGQTEITANVKAEYRRAMQNSNSFMKAFSLESTRQFTEKARHTTIFDRVERVGPAQQTIAVNGELEFGIEALAPRHWKFRWPSRRSLRASMSGIESEVRYLVDFYKTHPIAYTQEGIDQFMSSSPIFWPRVATVTKTLEFRNVHSSTVSVRNVAMTADAVDDDVN